MPDMMPMRANVGTHWSLGWLLSSWEQITYVTSFKVQGSLQNRDRGEEGHKSQKMGKSVICDGSYNNCSDLPCTQTRLTLSTTSHGKGKGSWGPILLNYWLLIDSGGGGKPLSLAVYPILRQSESKPMIAKMTLVNLSGSQNKQT